MAQDQRLGAFRLHLAAYLAVVALLAGINLLTNPGKLWFLWVLAGWGIGVAAHGLAVLMGRTRRRERIFIDPKARIFAVHLFAYIAVVLLLFVLNWRSGGGWWFYWVALAWGVGVAAHGWCVFIKHRGGASSSSATRAKGVRRRKR